MPYDLKLTAWRRFKLAFFKNCPNNPVVIPLFYSFFETRPMRVSRGAHAPKEMVPGAGLEPARPEAR